MSKHNLIHSGVDWKKVYLAQSKKWASRSEPVIVIKKADKEKISKTKKQV